MVGGPACRHISLLKFANKVHPNKLHSQKVPGLLFFTLSSCHLSTAAYHSSPRRFLSNRCGWEFDKEVTSTHPFNPLENLPMERGGQLSKQPTPSLLASAEVASPGAFETTNVTSSSAVPYYFLRCHTISSPVPIHWGRDGSRETFSDTARKEENICPACGHTAITICLQKLPLEKKDTTFEVKEIRQKVRPLPCMWLTSDQISGSTKGPLSF